MLEWGAEPPEPSQCSGSFPSPRWDNPEVPSQRPSSSRMENSSCASQELRTHGGKGRAGCWLRTASVCSREQGDTQGSLERAAGLARAELPTASVGSPWGAGLGWSCSSRSSTDAPQHRPGGAQVLPRRCPGAAHAVPRCCPRFLPPGASRSREAAAAAAAELICKLRSAGKSCP